MLTRTLATLTLLLALTGGAEPLTVPVASATCTDEAQP